MVAYMLQIPMYLFFVCVFTPVLLTERGLSSLHFFKHVILFLYDFWDLLPNQVF